MAKGPESELQVRDRAQKENARIAAEAARQKIADERAEHLAATARQNELAKSEIDLLMDELKDPERRQVRLAAVTLAVEQRMLSGNNSQAILDDLTLKLAKYMILGQA